MSRALSGPLVSARPEDSGRQPWLHDLEIAAHGNLTCLSDRSGDLDSPGTGLFVDDRRVLTRWTLTAEGQRPVRVSAHTSGATTRVLSVARNLGDEGPDPTIEVHRRRLLVDEGLREEVSVVSRWDRPLRCRLRLEAAGDGAELRSIKAGHGPRDLLTVTADGDGLAWRDSRHETRVRLRGATAEVGEDGVGALVWDAEIPAGGRQEWTVEVARTPHLRHRLRRQPGGSPRRLARRQRAGHGPPARPGGGARVRRSRRAGARRPGLPRRRVRGRGHAVVPHPVRAGLPVGCPPHAAVRH